jgi:hypothetical protein
MANLLWSCSERIIQTRGATVVLKTTNTRTLNNVKVRGSLEPGGSICLSGGSSRCGGGKKHGKEQVWVEVGFENEGGLRFGGKDRQGLFCSKTAARRKNKVVARNGLGDMGRHPT